MVSVRFDAEDFYRLAEHAEAEGMTVSAYVRRAVKEQKPIVKAAATEYEPAGYLLGLDCLSCGSKLRVRGARCESCGWPQ